MSDEITEPTVHLCWNDFAIRGAVHALRMANLGTMADDMEAQLKPAVEEPLEWGSVVRARRVGYGSEDTTTLRWQRRSSVGDSWVSEPAGDLGVHYHSDWSYLRNVEVLRVGIGEPAKHESLRCIGGMLDHPAHAMYCPAHGALRGKS